MTAFYGFFVGLGERLSHWLLLFVRLFWGLQFAVSGWQKIQNLNSTVNAFTSFGFSNADVIAPLVSYVELIGGMALALGFLSRITTLPLIVTMLVALFTAHKGFLAAPLTIVNEVPFPFLLAALMVFCFGPGRFSLDHMMMKTT